MIMIFLFIFKLFLKNVLLLLTIQTTNKNLSENIRKKIYEINL